MSGGESAFWQFSLRFYRRPEVPPLCLRLQDQYEIDVNHLFLLLFLATHGRRLTTQDVRGIDAVIATWRTHIVQPLRAIRRRLKSDVEPVDAAAAEALRNAIKRDELQAERLQQEAMEKKFPPHAIGTPSAPRDAAVANIAAYGALVGPLPDDAISALLQSLIDEFSL